MLPSADEKRLHNLVLISLSAVTLGVTPWFNLDPINLPKMLFLVVLSFVVIGILIHYRGLFLEKPYRTVLTVIALFQVHSFTSFVMSENRELAFWGAFGRNTGYLSYLSLSIFFLASIAIGKKSFAHSILIALISLSGINLAYGIFQYFDLDPIEWNNSFNPILGTLGNPNFVSAFLGMGAIASFSLLLAVQDFRARLFLTLLILGKLFISFSSDAIQGLAVTLVGMTIVFYFRFIRSMGTLKVGAYFLLVILGMFLGILGILQRGPFKSILYQESVTYRGDYWRAGWRMTLENPLFGVGMDGYGYWYRASRTEAAALRRGPDVTSNSAHNVFLDISSNGGFPLLIAYLFILGLAFRASIRVLRRSKCYDFVGVGLASCWIGYIFQSVVSINQLGLAIWGWVLPGAIIGYEIYGDEKNVSSKQSKRQILPPRKVLTGSLAFATGLVVAVGPVWQDYSFREALEKAEAPQIKVAALQWPRNIYYLDYATNLFLQNKVYDSALELSRLSVNKNSRNFNGWALLFNNPTATSAEKDEALKKIRELDPYNNTLPDR